MIDKERLEWAKKRDNRSTELLRMDPTAPPITKCPKCGAVVECHIEGDRKYIRCASHKLSGCDFVKNL